MAKPRIGVYALGGTIAMVPGDAGGVKPGLGADDLARAVPALPALADVKAETLAKVGSPSLTPEVVHDLAARIESEIASGAIDGAVVTQGTDTIEETAFLLDCLLDVPAPVIVIGAMRNPLMTSPDGPGNLLSAVRLAVDPTIRAKARDLGVLVAMLDTFHAAHEATKANTHRIDAFASPHGGPLGALIEDRVVLAAVPHRPHAALIRKALGPSPAARLRAASAPVAYLPMTLGDDGAALMAFVASPDTLGQRGFVLGLMGGGHAPHWLVEDIAALAARVPVVGCGRAGSGPLLQKTYEFPGAEIDLRRRGVIWGGRLHPLKARLLLGELLRAGASRATIAETFHAFA